MSRLDLIRERVLARKPAEIHNNAVATRGAFVVNSKGKAHRVATSGLTYCGQTIGKWAEQKMPPRLGRCQTCEEARLRELRADLDRSWKTGNHEGRQLKIHEISSIVNHQED